MSALFAELAYSETAIGVLSLRRRRDLALGIDVYEIKLDDEFLMSSLFTEGEVALATLGLDGLAAGAADVIVGGLGLGYTAAAALDHPRLRSLVVIDALPAVIDWHRRGLVPLGTRLSEDPRCAFRQGDFFALARDGLLAGDTPGGQVDAILIDVDHSPRNVLHPSHAGLYAPAGLRQLAAQLRPAGVFALWSNDPPDAAYMAALGEAFASAEAKVVRFPGLERTGDVENTVYVARKAAGR